MAEGQSKGLVFTFEIEKNESLKGGNSLPLLLVEVTSVSTFQLASRIKSKLQFFGWYVGDLESHTLNMPYRIVQTQSFTLEPAYPIETGKVDDYTREVVDSTPNGVFYHVTFSNLVPKIMIRGLVPSNQKRNMFDHPDRTYLFKKSEIRQTLLPTSTPSKKRTTATEHWNTNGKSTRAGSETQKERTPRQKEPTTPTRTRIPASSFSRST